MFFDLLEVDGKNLSTTPLLERKKLLKKLVGKNDDIIYCDHVKEHGKDFFSEVMGQNMEGMIAKRADSLYHEGIRTKEWLKIKFHQSSEAIIAGFTEPRGGRHFFGAIILGRYDNDGKLKYSGHAGTGFTESTLKELWTKMKSLVVSSSPFAERVKVNSPVTWIKPLLICQVTFTEQTRDGMLRHPVYMGLRSDKATKDVSIENEKPKHTQMAKKDATKEEKDAPVKIGNREMKLTNLDKIFWPEERYTKGDLINYYDSVADYILPYLKDRPLSLKRNPNGISDPGFFHKNAGDEAPSWVKKCDIFSEGSNRIIHYLVCNDKPSLVYIANLGCIEINPWNSTSRKLENPTYLIIDLDPSDKNSFEEVITVANAFRKLCDQIGAACYCKTSGSTGLHVFIPLAAKYNYDEVKEFGKKMAEIIARQLPEITSVERSLKKRGDKIYLDYLQNRKGQTIASVYSVRPKPGATVSVPLEWSEVKKGLDMKKFTIKTVIKRLEKKGDLFKNVLSESVDMKKCIKKVDELLVK